MPSLEALNRRLSKLTEMSDTGDVSIAGMVLVRDLDCPSRVQSVGNIIEFRSGSLDVPKRHLMRSELREILGAVDGKTRAAHYN